MEERIRPTKSGLFSIELLLCVGVFVFCAAVCTGIFVRAELTSRESAELNSAVNEARNLVELFQAARGSLEQVSAYSGGSLEDGGLVLLREGFVLRLVPAETRRTGTLTVSNGERTLLEWRIAVLPDANADDWEVVP